MAVNKKEVIFPQKTKPGVTLNSHDQLNGFFFFCGLYHPGKCQDIIHYRLISVLD
jgi:hypothetical protein